MHLNFTKMHGLGNDFIVIRGAEPLRPEIIRRLSNRHTGIGFDQLLWLDEPRDPGTDVYYRIFNADGGEVEQCGNGARCIARHVAEENNAGQDTDRVWKLAFPGGVISAQLQANGDVAVEMPVPDFSPASLPFVPPGPAKAGKYSLEAAGQPVSFAIVSMGNPHAVLEVDDVASAPVETLGALLEHHECFPNRANIGFMQVTGPARIDLRVFERGVGETMACGTGACAAVVVGRQAGKLADDVTVTLPGGELRVRWAGEGQPVWMIGEAVRVFEGVVAL